MRKRTRGTPLASSLGSELKSELPRAAPEIARHRRTTTGHRGMFRSAHQICVRTSDLGLDIRFARVLPAHQICLWGAAFGKI